MSSVAVIGSTGQLGTDLVKTFKKGNWDVFEISHKDLRVEDRFSLQSYFGTNPVDVVINTAALHQVGVCETNVGRSWSINAHGAANVAEIANEMGARAIFISTDYVFDGLSDAFYSETDGVSPINVYGASKAAGELSTLAASNRNIVARISSVFGAAGSSGKGGNFVETIIAKAKAGEVLKVVNDMYMSPSYTRDISFKLLELVNSNREGTFHLSNAGKVSWHGFAREICDQVGIDVTIEESATDYSQSPRRPANSALSTEKIVGLGITQRDWKSALREYLIEKGHLS